ncbi:hypothetical protein [Salinibacillus kushneri]|nr:hypothetical protein [Salinibacillus kushneri]
MCRQVGLGWDDMDNMTIGMCMDYIDEYIEQKNPNRTKVRQATQEDFDSF